MAGDIFLSVIIPAYNEGKRLGKTLDRIDKFFSGRGYKYEVIVMDDGSGDNTIDVASNSVLAKRSILQVFSNGENKGKGFSIREGFRKASGKFVLFTDADLSTPIEELEKLERAIHNGADIAIGSRSMKDSQVKVRQPLYRVMMGKTFNLFVQSIVISGMIDTQCGFKLFKKRCIEEILPDLMVDRFAFDVEMLYVARKKGYSIAEVPVVWNNFKESKVSPFRDSIKMFLDLFYIRFTHR